MVGIHKVESACLGGPRQIELYFGFPIKFLVGKGRRQTEMSGKDVREIFRQLAYTLTPEMLFGKIGIKSQHKPTGEKSFVI